MQSSDRRMSEKPATTTHTGSLEGIMNELTATSVGEDHDLLRKGVQVETEKGVELCTLLLLSRTSA